MRRYLAVAAIVSAGIAPVAAACSLSTPRQDIATIPEPAFDAGCVRLLALSDPTACRADWACDDGGSLTLFCGPLDGGRSCFCSVDDVTGDASTLPGDPCADGGYAAAALAACGAVEP